MVTNTTANSNSFLGWLSGVGGNGTDILNLEFCSGSGNMFEGLESNSANASSLVSYSNCVFSNNGNWGVLRSNLGTVETRTNNTMTGNFLAQTSGLIVFLAPL